MVYWRIGACYGCSRNLLDLSSPRYVWLATGISSTRNSRYQACTRSCGCPSFSRVGAVAAECCNPWLDCFEVAVTALSSTIPFAFSRQREQLRTRILAATEPGMTPAPRPALPLYAPSLRGVIAVAKQWHSVRRLRTPRSLSIPSIYSFHIFTNPFFNVLGVARAHRFLTLSSADRGHSSAEV